MAKEIERKFLVKDDGWRGLAESDRRILQGYLALDHGVTLRIRIVDGAHGRLTVKCDATRLSRDEFEYPIPLEDAREMMQASRGRVIEKTRYAIPFHGFVWEVDVYEGALDGLVVAEVELWDEADDPRLPGWVGREVTGDAAWSNAVLAIRGMPAGVTAHNAAGAVA